jgi:iron complex outermembrane recepter protein
MRLNKLFFLGLLCAQWAVAEESEMAPQVEADTQLDAMQIRAEVVEQPSTPANVPSTVQSVTSKQIAETVNSVSSAGALLYLPSVHVRERFIGDVNGGLAIRGYGVNSSAGTIVYADGLLLSNFLTNSCCPGPRWGMVPQNSIDRVDVMYGPFSALYPGNSVGGVVLMKTHMPTKFESHVKLDTFTENFKLYGTDDSYTGTHIAANLGNKINDFSFWVNADHLDNYSHPTDFTAATPRKPTGPLSNANNTLVVTGAHYGKDIANIIKPYTAEISADHTVKDDVTIKLGYDFTPTLHGTYTFDVWLNDSDKKSDTYLRDLAGNKIYGTSSTTGAAATTDPFRYVSINGEAYNVAAPYVSHGESEYHMHGLSLKTDTGKAFDWELIASYFNQNKDVTRQSSGNFGTTSGNNASNGTITYGDGTGWYNVDLRGDWRPSGDLKSEHQVSFGYHTDTYVTRSDQYNLGAGNWQHSDLASKNTNSRGKTSVDAIYLQDAWQLTPDLKLVLGGRQERWVAYDGSNFAAGKTKSYEDQTVSKFSPKASLTYEVNDNWSLKGSYGRGVRFPTVNELFKSLTIKQGSTGSGTDATPAQIAAFPAPFNVPLGNNAGLKPEVADSWEFSAERYLQNGVWRVSVFGEEKQDALVSQLDITTLPGYSFTSVLNVDKVRTYGAETALQTQDLLVNGLDVSGSVGWVHTRIVKDGADSRLEGTQLPLIPEIRASLLGTYHASDKLSYSLGWRYSGRQHSGLVNPATQKYPDPNPNVYGGRSNFSVFDVKVLYKFAKQWSASVGVDNITDEKYYTLYPYSQRTLFAGLKFDN